MSEPNESRAERELRRLRRCLRRYGHDAALLPEHHRVVLRQASELRDRVIDAFAEHASPEAIETAARERFAAERGGDFDALSEIVRDGWLRSAKTELAHAPDALVDRLARSSFVATLRKSPEDFDAAPEFIRDGWIVAAEIVLLIPPRAWPLDENMIWQAIDGMRLLLGEATK